MDLSNVKVGDWVEVTYDYEPGTCSDGGIGIITRLIETDNGPDTEKNLGATVQYILDNRKEHGVSMRRLTAIPMPYKSDVILRPRKIKQAAKNFEKFVEKRTPLGWLKWGLTTRKHEIKGWLAETLVANGELVPGEGALWRRVLSDYRCQLAFLEGMKEVLADGYTDPRQYQQFYKQNVACRFYLPDTVIVIAYFCVIGYH